MLSFGKPPVTTEVAFFSGPSSHGNKPLQAEVSVREGKNNLMDCFVIITTLVSVELKTPKMADTATLGKPLLAKSRLRAFPKRTSGVIRRVRFPVKH